MVVSDEEFRRLQAQINVLLGMVMGQRRGNTGNPHMPPEGEFDDYTDPTGLAMRRAARGRAERRISPEEAEQLRTWTYGRIDFLYSQINPIETELKKRIDLSKNPSSSIGGTSGLEKVVSGLRNFFGGAEEEKNYLPADAQAKYHGYLGEMRDLVHGIAYLKENLRVARDGLDEETATPAQIAAIANSVRGFEGCVRTAQTRYDSIDVRGPGLYDELTNAAREEYDRECAEKKKSTGGFLGLGKPLKDSPIFGGTVRSWFGRKDK